MLLTSLHCEDCQMDFEFPDEVPKNTTNLSKNECNNYFISLIKKNEDNRFEYTVIIKCKICKNFISQTFIQKENNFNFKCQNCKLKGITFSYFLSIEDDVNQKYVPPPENKPIIIENDEPSIQIEPLNEEAKYTNLPPDKIQDLYISREQSYQQLNKNNQNFMNNNINNAFSARNYVNNNNKISKIQENELNFKSQYNNKNKIYKTPDQPKKYKVIFIKNDEEHSFLFDPKDNINKQIDIIKQKINLGKNPVFYYNSEEIDLNKFFEENKIVDDLKIEVEEKEEEKKI